MGRLAAAAAAVLLTPHIAASSPVVLPPDNDRTRFRTSAAMFQNVWQAPLLMDGKAASRTDPTDLALHSKGIQPMGAKWWDALYPVQWELDFQGGGLCAGCRSFWWISYVAAVLYVAGLRWGQAAMEERKAWNLHVPLAAWNLFLAVFSLVGALRTVPHLLLLLSEHGFDYTVCRAGLPMYGNGPVGFWVAAFIFSKYFELIDTVFLVLRRRTVGFLHWYHHFSVLLYCWHAYIWEMPTGIYFVSMNYSVHAIMYFYYFLSSVCSKPPRWALLVTVLQLLQMAVGIAVTLSHLYRLHHGSVANCDGHVPNLALAAVMYASYFCLFGEFLVKRYCRRKPSSGASKAANGANAINGKAKNGTAAKKME